MMERLRGAMTRRLDIVADGHRLEASWEGEPAATAIVLLHEGLGAVGTWRELPRALHAATGAAVLAYSRCGYGRSAPIELPRPLDYMEHEGEHVVAAVLDAANIDRAILVGHSDGGSIAIVAAGCDRPVARRVAGLALLAAHVFCEDVSVASIERARGAYLEGDLRSRLAKYHDDVDGAFWGWNRAWLDPGFRAWNIERYLASIAVPTLVVQGADDPYGTLAQVDAIERGLRGPVTRLVLPGCGHAPHRERPDETVAAVADLVASAR
jgi:pimeloyl-ACP methyl ester carboxylesterase